jgi:hypothetical protein
MVKEEGKIEKPSPTRKISLRLLERMLSVLKKEDQELRTVLPPLISELTTLIMQAAFETELGRIINRSGGNYRSLRWLPCEKEEDRTYKSRKSIEGCHRLVVEQVVASRYHYYTELGEGTEHNIRTTDLNPEHFLGAVSAFESLPYILDEWNEWIKEHQNNTKKAEENLIVLCEKLISTSQNILKERKKGKESKENV